MASPSAAYTSCATAAEVSGLPSGVAAQALRFLIGWRSFDESAGKLSRHEVNHEHRHKRD
jgi:hypothetical protein